MRSFESYETKQRIRIRTQRTGLPGPTAPGDGDALTRHCGGPGIAAEFPGQDLSEVRPARIGALLPREGARVRPGEAPHRSTPKGGPASRRGPRSVRAVHFLE